jgi:hypothetical protein
MPGERSTCTAGSTLLTDQKGLTTMTSTQTPRHLGRRTFALALAAAAIAVAACSSAVGADPTPPVPPSDQPVVTPAPVVTPVPVGTPVVSPEPTDGEDAVPITVHLETRTAADVYVDIVDRIGILGEAVTGHPAEGASIEPGVLKVENVDERTLRLSWSTWLLEGGLALYLDEDQDGPRFTLILPPPGDGTDAMAVDHILLLTFDEPVSADDVEAILQEGVDTPA